MNYKNFIIEFPQKLVEETQRIVEVPPRIDE